jgi:large subunit ribosomal protein L9
VEVVLREDVDHVGLRGEVVNVARGYARNYLLPRGLAEVATPGLVRELERRAALRARQEANTNEEARAIAERIEKTELRFDVTAGPTGSLFGSVTPTNVADRLWEEQKIRIDRRKLGMETIKRIGRYTVPVDVFTDVTAELRLLVVPEGGELPSDAELEAATAAEAAAEAAGVETPAASDGEPRVAGASEAEPTEAGPTEAAAGAGPSVEADPAAEAAPAAAAESAAETQGAPADPHES